MTPVLLDHSSRAFTWGAAIAALHGIAFDRELLHLAAMFHDTGLPSPVPEVDFTARSAAVAVTGGELKTDHSFSLAGQRFLTLRYEIERLPAESA